jgi:putative transposase
LRVIVTDKLRSYIKPIRQAQRILGAHDQINTILRPRRYRLSTISYRHAGSDAFDRRLSYALEMTA